MGNFANTLLYTIADLETKTKLIKYMGSVSYKNQPAIDKTKGNVPLAGTSHIYRVKKKL